MKRKITVILAADVAGYSRLVAEDEEEAVGRLASYRAVFEDAISTHNGRVFNTAGDSILAEFDSAVDAVRCAMDVQESLRTRNMAYPVSRQMNFRIGINIGDVVSRDTDLLGDGVNIAARLESIAPPGGICISRSVHEAVANKLTVKFSDLGERQLKNMPDPVHAYVFGSDDTKIARSGLDETSRKRFVSFAAAAAGIIAVVAIGVLGVRYLGDSGGGSSGAVSGVNQAQQPAAANPEDTAQSAQSSATGDSAPSPAEEHSKSGAASGGPAPGATTVAASGDAAASSESSSAGETLPQDPVPSGAEGTSKPAPAREKSRTDILAANIVLQRNWKACLEGDPQTVLSACQPIVDGRLLDGEEFGKVGLRYAAVLRDNRETDKAISVYTAAIEAHPTAATHHGRAIAHYDKGDWEKSIADFNEAIRVDDKNGQYYNDRAWTRFQAGDPRMALPDADIAVRLLPGRANVWDTRGHIHEALGNRDDSIRDFRKALALDPSTKSSSEGLVRLGAGR